VNARLFVGDQVVQAPAPDDRGLAYGDGLFETMRVHRGTLPWWDAHWTRLAQGAARLRLPLPDPCQVRREAAALFADAGDGDGDGDGVDGVLKLLVSRGSGGRGYAPPPVAVPAWQLSRHPLPPAPRDGLQLRWCETRLAWQPALAGLKHCNRLEQVLARMECIDAAVDEGLMLDADDSVLGAVSANLFVLHGEQWRTPSLDRCGVAGICRAQLLPRLDAIETRLAVADIDSADAVFLCNAVRGILPVARLGDRSWPPHAAIAAARRELARLHPGFASPE